MCHHYEEEDLSIAEERLEEADEDEHADREAPEAPADD